MYQAKGGRFLLEFRRKANEILAKCIFKKSIRNGEEYRKHHLGIERINN